MRNVKVQQLLLYLCHSKHCNSMDKISFSFPNHKCITKTWKHEASQNLQNTGTADQY